MDKDKLKQTVDTTSKKLKEYNELYLKNETALRNQIINPILTSLGWNIEDPEDVRVEEKTTDREFADYTLIKDKRRVLFIEAKNLSGDIELYEQMKQLAKYAFSEGVSFGLLTNGKKWLLLRSYEEDKSLADRKLWVVDIIDDDIEKVILRLKSISKENIHNLNSLIKKQDLLSVTWQTIVSSPESLVKPVSEIIKQQISGDDEKFSNEEIEEFVHMKLIELTKGEVSTTFNEDSNFESEDLETQQYESYDKLPTKIVIRNFSRNIGSFIDILVETANYLMDNKLLDKSRIPVSSGYKRFIINIKPVHNDGKHFTAPAKLNCGYWVETHNSGQKSIEYAKRLLRAAGIPESELKLT